jgi:CubicO group peptidase (beta-lactamase class C family)
MRRSVTAPVRATLARTTPTRTIPACATPARTALVTAGLVLLALAAAAPAPARAEPDADLLGATQGYPVGGPPNWYLTPYRVGSWSTMDKTGLPVREVPRGQAVTPLPRMANPPAVQYRWRNLGYTLDEYLERRRITGLLILKNGEIVAEHYRYGRTPEARFLSFSMAKSVTALLIGIAIDKGLIASVDDPAEKYVTALAGSAYGGTSIRHLLRMSSGVKFTELYDGNDDISRLSRAMYGTGPRPVALLKTFNERLHPAGEKFAYATAETEVLGRVLTAAAGRDMAQLTSEWVWQPLGAERDALWRVSVDGQEQAGGGFAAALRDWGRLGLLLARDGRVGERQVVPQAWLLDATDVSRQPPAFAPGRATPYLGYGYQFWLLPQKARTFVLQGIHGQAVFVQPSSGIVMVHTAVYEGASGRQDPEPYAERSALWLGVLRSLGGAPQ